MFSLGFPKISEQHFRTCAHVCTLPYVRMCENFGFFCAGAVLCGNSKNMSRTHTMNHLKMCQKNQKKSSKNENMYLKNDFRPFYKYRRAQWCGVGCGAEIFLELWWAVRCGIWKFWEMLFTSFTSNQIWIGTQFVVHYRIYCSCQGSYLCEFFS